MIFIHTPSACSLVIAHAVFAIFAMYVKVYFNIIISRRAISQIPDPTGLLMKKIPS